MLLRPSALRQLRRAAGLLPTELLLCPPRCALSLNVHERRYFQGTPALAKKLIRRIPSKAETVATSEPTDSKLPQTPRTVDEPGLLRDFEEPFPPAVTAKARRNEVDCPSTHTCKKIRIFPGWPGVHALVYTPVNPPTAKPLPVILHLSHLASNDSLTVPPLSADAVTVQPYHPDLPLSFPHLLHEALSIFDCVRKKYPHPQHRIVLYGEGLSGGLALSIALTEGRDRIPAVAAIDPIVDWTIFGDFGWDFTDSVWVSTNSHMLRDSYLGKKPETWLDPFASPLFFLKTPGVEVTPPIALAGEGEDLAEEGELWMPSKKRRTPRRFPELDGRRLPTVLVGMKKFREVEPESLLFKVKEEVVGVRREAVMEFVRALRRCWVEWEGDTERGKEVGGQEVLVMELEEGRGEREKEIIESLVEIVKKLVDSPVETK